MSQQQTLELLRACYIAYVKLLQVGYDRIKQTGSECDSVQKMENSDPHLILLKKEIAKIADREERTFEDRVWEYQQ